MTSPFRAEGRRAEGLPGRRISGAKGCRAGVIAERDCGCLRPFHMEHAAWRRALRAGLSGPLGRIPPGYAALVVFGCSIVAAQPPNNPFPANSTALPSHPWFLKKTWVVGGQGNWDYLAVDPTANRLYIAHQAEVQVVDIETGKLAGTVKGLREAHAIALDTTGEHGFVSDGLADEVVVFDRRSLEVLAHVPVKIGPRALVFEPQTGMLVAVSPGPDGAPPPYADPAVIRHWAEQQWSRALAEKTAQEQPGKPRTVQPIGGEPPRFPCFRGSPGPNPAPPWESMLTVIDPEANAAVAEIRFCGHAGTAAADANGAVYTALGNNDEILHFDISQVVELAHAAKNRTAGDMLKVVHGEFAGGILRLDWREQRPYVSPGASSSPQFEGFSSFGLWPACRMPRALAVDGAHQRLFAACNNQKLVVVNTGTGKTQTTLAIGPGVDAIGFDAGRGYLYSANGGGDGTLTIIRQDVPADSYNVVQTLPTRHQARTLAVNSSTGEVYLVSILETAKLDSPPPRNGIGKLKVDPQDESFQVLVVDN